MLFGLMIALILAMRLFPDTPAAQSLHKYLVEMPLIWWERLDRRQVLFVILTALLMFAFWEAIAVFGSMDAILLYTFDLALYLDAVIAAVTLTATTNIEAMRSRLRARLVRWTSKQGPAKRLNSGTRHRRLARKKLPTNDDEPASRTLVA